MQLSHADTICGCGAPIGTAVTRCERAPKPGDVALCLHCGQAFAFAGVAAQPIRTDWDALQAQLAEFPATVAALVRARDVIRARFALCACNLCFYPNAPGGQA